MRQFTEERDLRIVRSGDTYRLVPVPITDAIIHSLAKRLCKEKYNNATHEVYMENMTWLLKVAGRRIAYLGKTRENAITTLRIMRLS